MSKCDWEVIEGDEGEHEGTEYTHFICNQCGAMSWNPNGEWPKDCIDDKYMLYKDTH